MAAERLAANLDGIDGALGTVRHARQKARDLRDRADDLMAVIVQELGDKAMGPAADQPLGGRPDKLS